METWLFLGCIAVAWAFGWGACDTHYHTTKEGVRQKHQEALKEKDEEIARLRTQVAMHMGKEVTGGCADPHCDWCNRNMRKVKE